MYIYLLSVSILHSGFGHTLHVVYKNIDFMSFYGNFMKDYSNKKLTWRSCDRFLFGVIYLNKFDLPKSI